MTFGGKLSLVGITASAVILVGCRDSGPTGPAGTYDLELSLDSIEVVADCEGPLEDSPGEWTWQVTLQVARQPMAEFGTPGYPDFAGNVPWTDGGVYDLGESAAVKDIPGSQVPFVTLALEATEWDIGSDPPNPDALMNGRIVRRPVPFAIGTVEGTLGLADDSGKCSILLSYSIVWRPV